MIGDAKDPVILVRAPLGRDEQVLSDLLTRHGYDVIAPRSSTGFLEHLERGDAELLVLSEEALAPATVRQIGATLESEPAWAALPLVVLINGSDRAAGPIEQLRKIRPALPVTLLTRPTSAVSVISAVDGALRARQSQRLVGRLLEEREAAEAQARRLLGELDHRTKNLLGTIDALAHQTLSRAASAEDFLHSFSSRLRAMAHTHDVLASGEFRAVGLEGLARRILGSLANDPRQLEISGPEIVLPPGLGQTIGMCLHELGTNARKYGALSVLAGRVCISWSFDPTSRRLRIDWREENGPPVRAPEEESFGIMFIRGSFEFHSLGEAVLEFAPAGLRCTMSIELAEQTAQQPVPR